MKKLKRSSLSLFSPAKINLFLYILSKREDGYHEIATLMQSVSLGDVLHITLSDEDQVTSTSREMPHDQSNLVCRAIEHFRLKTGLLFPVSVHIEKQIPIGGGFGGGSSNASTILWALNLFCGNPFGEEILQKWAAEISSDSPFFFSSGRAYATGRGEQIRNLPPIKQKLYLAICKRSLSSSLIYQNCQPRSCSSHSFLERFNKTPTYVNDLEKSAFSLCKELSTLKRALLNLGFETVSMTGSGSGFFCLGSLQDPRLPGVKFIPVTFLAREENGWYTPSNQIDPD